MSDVNGYEIGFYFLIGQLRLSQDIMWYLISYDVVLSNLVVDPDLLILWGLKTFLAF